MASASSVYPPGPGSPLLSYFALRRDPLGFMMRVVRKYGDIVHMQVGSRHDYLLNHPDHIRDVLLAPEGMLRSSARPLRKALGQGVLTTTGEPHRTERRLLQPLFGRQHAAPWSAVVVDHALRKSHQWRTGVTVDIASEMASLSQGIIVRLTLGVDRESGVPGLTDLLDQTVDGLNRNTFPSLLELLFHIPRRSARALERTVAELDGLLYRMIAERRTSGSRGDDLLSGMLAVRDERAGGAGMTDTQIRDELMTFISAGHETIGNALTWTWYLLSQHPDSEAEMHAEVDAVLGGRPPTSADIARLPTIEAILKESLRLYPPVWVVARRPVNDWPLGDYVVPAGSYFQICPYVTHRDPRYFPNADAFEPRRWLDEGASKPGRTTYFPFAAGVHRCIGESLAWTEGILALATLAQRWRLRMTRPDRQPRPEALITLRPKGGLPMRIEAR